VKKKRREKRANRQQHLQRERKALKITRGVRGGVCRGGGKKKKEGLLGKQDKMLRGMRIRSQTMRASWEGAECPESL